MTKSLYNILLVLIILLAAGSPAFSQDVTLSWDASPTAGVVGYKVYYKPNNSTLPFDGSGANEGLSPLDVGDQLTATLTGLADNSIYYFAVTAYDAAGNESSFSNIVTNSWVPELLSPANQAVDEPVPATFRWSTEPTGLPINYTLYYGTDSGLVTTAGILSKTTPPPSPPLSPEAIIIMLIALALLLAVSRRTPLRRRLTLAGGILAAAIVVSACGGGGGGGETSSTKASTEAPNTSATVYAVDKGSSDYHQAYDLLPETTYYWKVIGVNANDQTQTYSSTVASFTT
ncbi:MAG: fibronectin type III domain-containing protein, partial [Deltaproteobacteria bacterium]|nr:fibronectin type III domain-containing protein [Deltaproteobacteria bacterium]